MTAEQYFRRLIYIDQRINADLEEIYRLRQMMTCIPSPNLEGEISGNGGVPRSRVENVVTKLVDLEKQVTEEIDSLVDLKAEAWEVLKRIENKQQRLVLQGYYIDRQRIDDIADTLGVTHRRVTTIKREALREAEKIIFGSSL